MAGAAVPFVVTTAVVVAVVNGMHGFVAVHIVQTVQRPIVLRNIPIRLISLIHSSMHNFFFKCIFRWLTIWGVEFSGEFI